MSYALRLGEQGRLTSPPNPWVGCIVVKDDAIVGQGYHARVGTPHAEVIALDQAKEYARGATVYTTLEPCAHVGRTPPCIKALIKAKVARVVIPFLDPDPKVAGRGKKGLEAAGIEVIVGVGEKEARASLLPYLHHRETGRPYVVMKLAISLDGKGAAADGSSQWITREEARQNGHLLRAESQAIVIGSKTAVRDRPQLTVRGINVSHSQPLRIVLDRAGVVPSDSPLFDLSLAPTLVVGKTLNSKIECLPSCSLEDLLVELGKREILQVLVEGGPTLQHAFLERKLVNKCHLFVGGCLLGERGLSAFPSLMMTTMAEAKRWSLEGVYRFGNDVRLDYCVNHP